MSIAITAEIDRVLSIARADPTAADQLRLHPELFFGTLAETHEGPQVLERRCDCWTCIYTVCTYWTANS